MARPSQPRQPLLGPRASGLCRPGGWPIAKQLVPGSPSRRNAVRASALLRFLALSITPWVNHGAMGHSIAAVRALFFVKSSPRRSPRQQEQRAPRTPPKFVAPPAGHQYLDMVRFLELTKGDGIDVWVTLVPPWAPDVGGRKWVLKGTRLADSERGVWV